ncbi:MAG: agmatinase [Candidatus Methanomethylophilaceae archaeon]|jgi:agmatinase|nr:agmatinase [Candidatus Methanomethylophilaceae archaeon]NLF33502.1 agmatinase [Thermoplasmatales archaeon]
MPYGTSYAGADSDYDDADIVIVGVPYDHTSCFRAGSREAPAAIRRASYNFEETHFEHGVGQTRPRVHDYGNCDEYFLPEDMFDDVNFALGPAIRDGKFTIAIGGEHSVNIPIIRNFDKDDISLISIDAHLDSRDEYMGSPNSHACITRRAAEHLGMENVFVLGVRSISEEELDRDDVIPYIDSYTMMEKGVEWAFGQALEHVHNERIYLTLDIDGIDPAFAPGTGTQEPFGLMPIDVKKIINMAGKRLAGFDVVEVCPPADPSGITANLAARYINEVIAVHGKNLAR